MTKVVWKSMAMLAIVTSMLLAACGGDDDPSPEEAQADLCADLAGLQTTVDSVAGMGATASVEDLQDQRDAIEEAMDEVRSSADDVADAEIEALDEAYNSLDEAVGDIENDMPIAEALTSIQDEIAGVQAAWNEVFTATGCS